MKYKVGDKVKIKTWEDMEKKYGLNTTTSNISCYGGYNCGMEEIVKNLNTNRIVTIKQINNTSYNVEEHGYAWTDDMIECLASKYVEPGSIPILSRFEILDL